MSQLDWWSVDLHAGLSLLVVKEPPVMSVDHLLGQCFATLEQLIGTSIGLRLDLCVVNLQHSPRTSDVCAACYSLAGQHFAV